MKYLREWRNLIKNDDTLKKLISFLDKYLYQDFHISEMPKKIFSDDKLLHKVSKIQMYQNDLEGYETKNFI